MLARWRSRLPVWVLLGPLLASAIFGASCGLGEDAVPAACRDDGNTAIFERRIAPLLSDDRPKSCNACHLSGIDMTLFVRSTPCETMACLGELGLVDLSAPESSQVLSWIDRAKPLSPLIDAAVVQAEYDGFLEWIQHNAECGRFECAGVVCTARENEPFCDVVPEPFAALDPATDAGGCSDLELERLFRDTVYASRGRCYPCHFDSEKNPPEALHFIEQSGSCDSSSLQTMHNVLSAGLVDVAAPDQSLLLLKPLAEGGGGVPHGGHEKFFPGGDPGYQNFRYWLERYAACQGHEG